MHISAKLATAVAAAGLLTAGCTTNPETGNQRMSKAGIGAIAGVVGGFLVGDLVGGRRDRTEKILGAGIGALAGAGIGHYMDEQEKKLRQQTAGTDVEVVRNGDEILLNMPSGVTFDTNSYTVKPEFQGTLNQVASTLSQYNQTYIDVYGHTDSTGNDTINIPLSQNRAQAVASYLTQRGVVAARIGTQGFGSSQPVATNDTPVGRQANRRVEIKIVPVTEGDVRGG
ncbi:OmpA family protein [Sphingomonas sp. C3-2]|uniref:OmpA family protein n=1 Tax=Sphingomonas sp. C3-2 TaxID=3062169 RepID=UPI00294ABD67|nr:OmpA family protein [Sphingomonas sp. C3-2]WOK37879.1 OmpA family protein [Sphingomonas sp. C3-2]